MHGGQNESCQPVPQKLAIFEQRHVLCQNGAAMNFIRIFLFLAIGLFPLVAFTQKPGKVFPEGTAGVNYNLRDAKGKKHGQWIRVYKDQPSTLYYRGQFTSGIPIGKFEFYSTDGSLSSVVDHVKDSTINDVTFFYPDGSTVKSVGRYLGTLENGKWVRRKDGNWKTYSSAGVLLSDENYTADVLEGSCKYYYPTGKMVALYSYKSGQRSGPFSTWYENGKKEKEGFYLRDDFDGAYKSWHENGAMESEGSYASGVKEGTWYFYSSSGEPEITILYKKGVEVKRKHENGTFTEYYDSGIPKSEYSYESGKRNGPFKEWYDQGQFVQVPGSKEDAEVGIMYREKLEGVQLRIEGDYLNDQLEGDVIYYTEKGTIEKIETWAEGKLISVKEK
jgi:antitoxin component YwqK of YwqJK toxin-antitoxin module